MKKSFNTKEKALKHLEYRRSCAYSRIEKSGDKILSDASFVYKDFKDKWCVFLQIFTERMIKDLEEDKRIIAGVHQLIPYTTEEELVKKEKKTKELEKKYKTLDFENYRINKDL